MRSAIWLLLFTSVMRFVQHPPLVTHAWLTHQLCSKLVEMRSQRRFKESRTEPVQEPVSWWWKRGYEWGFACSSCGHVAYHPLTKIMLVSRLAMLNFPRCAAIFDVEGGNTSTWDPETHKHKHAHTSSTQTQPYSCMVCGVNMYDA